MKLIALFFIVFALSGCSKNNQDFKDKYVKKFVSVCSKGSGSNEMMIKICECQAKMIVDEMTPSDTSDKDKVRQFIISKAAPQCAAQAFSK